MSKNIIIRNGKLDDLTELKKLFIDTVTTVCKSDYDNEQIEAWIADTKNNVHQQRWEDVLTKQFVLVAQLDDKIIGFATLENGTYLDFLYVHKDYQRQGVADRLYAEIENEAKRRQKDVLTSEVSTTARPFFEKQKFELISEQIVIRNRVKLTNYRMQKAIDNCPNT